MNSASLRDQVLALAAKQYHTQPEHLWARNPDHAVLRHANNRKWYALLMDVPKDRLGLDGTEHVEILNLKVDPVMAGSFLLQAGILPGYHMNKANWITVLLDGTVPMDTIELLLDVSFTLTDEKKGGVSPYESHGYFPHERTLG